MTTLNRTETTEYRNTFGSALHAIAAGGEATGLVAEVSATLERGAHPNIGRGLHVPLAMLLRAQTTGTFSAGGALVQDATHATDPAPRAASVMERAGATILTGLRDDLKLPRQTGAETVTWVSELDETSATSSAFGVLHLSPHLATGSGTLSAQLNVQTNGNASRFTVASLRAGVASALDAAALAGDGIAGSPLGVFNMAGPAEQIFGGSPVWQDVLDMQETAAAADADDEALVWISHPAVRKKWRSVQRFSGTDATLWACDSDTVASRPALVTTSAPSTGIILGDFTKSVIGVWGESAVVIVDPYTLKKTGNIEFTVQLLADCGHLRPELLVRNADSAIQ